MISTIGGLLNRGIQLTTVQVRKCGAWFSYILYRLLGILTPLVQSAPSSVPTQSVGTSKYAAAVTVVRALTSSGRSRRKRKKCWLLYVQINLDLPVQQVRDRYRARFGIEVSYRQMRTAHAKTTSRNAAVRFFLLALAFILVNGWAVLRWRFCQIPRRGGRQLDKPRFSVGRMMRFLRRAIEGVYGTVDQIEAFAEPLSP